jgi:hypothetical protein
MLLAGAGAPAFALPDATKEVSAQRRARITVTPRVSYPGPNATRECTAWLQRENRPSGPVLTPQMRCWWR